MKELNVMIKKYGFILLILVGTLGCCVKKNSHLQTTVVSNPNSQIVVSTNDVVEQTWQPHVKEITGISVPFDAADTFSTLVKLDIMTDDRKEVLVSEVVQKQFVKGESGTVEFRFENLKLILGERYRIQVSFENWDNKGELFWLPEQIIWDAA